MSFMDKRQHKTTSEQQTNIGVLQPLGSGSENPLVGQLPFPEYADVPTGAIQTPTAISSSRAMTRTFPEPITSPGVTRQLSDYTPPPEVQTGALFMTKSTTTSLREPVVIRGSGARRSTRTTRPPTRRRMMVHVAVTTLLAFVVLGTLLAVIPVGGGHAAFNIFAPILNFAKSSGNNTGIVAQQAATATAVMQDGYYSGSGQTYAGLPTAPPSYRGTGTYNPFYYGQCTYWADYRYHQITGYWIPWVGSALVWGYNAPGYGWTVSAKPRVPSIIVLQPGTQSAGGYGHVAVVESINADGSVNTSGWNWYGAGFAQTVYVTFRPGPGVRFVWHP